VSLHPFQNFLNLRQKNIMNRHKKLFLTLQTAAVCAVAGIAGAQAQIITFDDLPTPAGNGSSVIPNGYGGLQWQNFNYLNGVTLPANPSGYQYADVSPDNVAFNSQGQPATITSGTAFDLNSGYFTGAWRDGLQVEVQGFVGATLTYDNTYTLISTAPILLSFNYTGVDKVVFTSSGGTLNPNYHDPDLDPPLHTDADQFAMDNLTINATPEPSTVALAGLGIAFVLARRRLFPKTSAS
jgi:hypothetical protein